MKICAIIKRKNDNYIPTTINIELSGNTELVKEVLKHIEKEFDHYERL